LIIHGILIYCWLFNSLSFGVTGPSDIDFETLIDDFVNFGAYLFSTCFIDFENSVSPDLTKVSRFLDQSGRPVHRLDHFLVLFLFPDDLGEVALLDLLMHVGVLVRE